MKITVVTLFPVMIQNFVSESIVKRAVEKGFVEIEIINLRDFANSSYGSVDDRPYGGGAGMVMRVDCIKDALNSLPNKGHVLLTSAKGTTYSQSKAKELSKLESITIIAGHYEGVDERVLEFVDEEISIGDFVMTGGEIASAAIIDSIVRLIPGVLKKDEATEIESFYEVSIGELMSVVAQDEELVRLKESGVKTIQLLEYPQYTRPEVYDGKKVPEILLSGNHAEINKWQMKESYLLTKKLRPDLIK